MLPAFETLLSNYETSINEVESKIINGEIKGWRLFEELETIEQPVGDAWSVVSHLQGVKNSDDLRNAHQKVLPNYVKTMTVTTQSVPIYNALEAIKGNEDEWKSLANAQKRIVDKNLNSMKNEGVNLTGEKQKRFNEIKTELAELSTEFSNNLLDATKKWSLTITDPAEIEGFPESLKLLTAQQAESADAEKGPWKLTLDAPVLGPVLQQASSRRIREKIYMENITKAGEENAPIIEKIMRLREEKANLLGYNCHADLSLSTKMAGNTKNVNDLTQSLRDRAYPAAKKEVEELKKFAESRGHVGNLEPWDLAYYAEKQREELFGFTQEELRPYFALPNVLEGLFSLCEKLFDVTIVEAHGEEAGQKFKLGTRTFNFSTYFRKMILTSILPASFWTPFLARKRSKGGHGWQCAVNAPIC